MSKLFDELVEDVFNLEGGYSNDPKDSGGETNYGVTEQVARSGGYTGSMKEMFRSDALDIYRKLYWTPINGDLLGAVSEAIAQELFDTGINQGVGRAGMYLQKCLNLNNDNQRLYPDIKVDNSIGPKTIETLKTYLRIRHSEGGEIVLLRMLNTKQGAWYMEVQERNPKNERFNFGWFKNRVVI